MAVSGAKERIDAALQGWRDHVQPHRFGGTEYSLGDERSPRARRQLGGHSLSEDRPQSVAYSGRAEPHHILPTVAGQYLLEAASDVDRAIELLRLPLRLPTKGLRNRARLKRRWPNLLVPGHSRRLSKLKGTS